MYKHIVITVLLHNCFVFRLLKSLLLFAIKSKPIPLTTHLWRFSDHYTSKKYTSLSQPSHHTAVEHQKGMRDAMMWVKCSNKCQVIWHHYFKLFIKTWLNPNHFFKQLQSQFFFGYSKLQSLLFVICLSFNLFICTLVRAQYIIYCLVNDTW